MDEEGEGTPDGGVGGDEDGQSDMSLKKCHRREGEFWNQSGARIQGFSGCWIKQEIINRVRRRVDKTSPGSDHGMDAI
jgi:hypothetical protein